MTVRELIEALRRLPQDLPVAVADWNERWSHPSGSAAESVGVFEGPYYPAGEEGGHATTGRHVVIG